MSGQQQAETVLGTFRVLDLTDDKGFYCGKVLGDLGADVIKIEPPGGDRARSIGPFYKDIPHPERSLYWWAYNTSKRGITLNIESADGREIFRRLAKTADVIVESFPPGYMDNLGLGYSALSDINPRIIMTSITPFGQTGPYKDYKGSDLIVWSLGGAAYVTGDGDRPPCRVSFPQAYIHAGIQAASGTLVALYYRELSGEGQHVDISAHEAVTWAAFGSVQGWDMMEMNATRFGSRRMLGQIPVRAVYPCKDGYVSFVMLGGLLGSVSFPPLIKWMAEEGMLGAFEERRDWGSDRWAQEDVTLWTQEDVAAQEDSLLKFFITKTQAEIYEQTLKRRMLVYPVSNTEQLSENIQLKERGFYVNAEHRELSDTITYTGAPYKMTETPWRMWRRPPLIGEHNQELYEGELGFSKEEMRLLKEAEVI